ncbi:hypothetical protein PRZ48_004050 [Zasmidium cellare]|uniref:F-box domain-containing protein n=1 Tax=Zasmidium cellare TaxID=395010 RepID=A0ABR0EYE0_ZASCE|nr:hypothetical protein PRZ48_004050 [Zasmidium cellare]
MSEQALQEPAILHLIFLHLNLNQPSLLQAQKVCRTWRKTILTSKTLLKVLSLHPRIPAHATAQEDTDPSTLDPLLSDIFLSFLNWGPQSWDGHRGNTGPWIWTAEKNWTSDLSKYEKFRYPEASWRKMLPWNDPPPTQLQVHVEGSQGGTVARLNFDNETTWLTMGLLWDIVENAWFRGEPWWLSRVDLEGPGKQQLWRRSGPIPASAKVSHEVQKAAERRPGRINLNLTIDDRSAEERTVARDKAVAEYRATVKKIEGRWFKPCGTKPRRVTACDLHVFTDEFHVEGGKAFRDVQWDEIWKYEIEKEEEDQEVVEVQRPRKKGLRRLLGRPAAYATGPQQGYPLPQGYAVPQGYVLAPRPPKQRGCKTKIAGSIGLLTSLVNRARLGLA